MNLQKYKIDYILSALFTVLLIIGLIAIYSAQNSLSTQLYDNYALKQSLWIIAGIISIIVIMLIGNDILKRLAFILYISTILLLLSIFILPQTGFISAPIINGARSWIKIGSQTIQPSEFMKITLIMYLAKTFSDFFDKYDDPSIKNEFFLLFKIVLITAIPLFITFMQPDSGLVIIMIFSVLSIIFISGIRLNWIVFVVGTIILIGILFFSFLIFYPKVLENIFGSEHFYKLNRLYNWIYQNEFQLNLSKIAIGSSGINGHGFLNTPLSIPEPQTDFIIAVFASNFGFFGTTFLLMVILFFDFRIINIGQKSTTKFDSYLVAGILGFILFQQFYNMGMTLGIVPIMGITQPFISYGGSSILSNFLAIGLILNVSCSIKKQTHLNKSSLNSREESNVFI